MSISFSPIITSPFLSVFIKRVEQLGKKDNQPKLLINTDKKGDVMIGENEIDIEDDLSYDEMSYKSSDSVFIEEIPGVEYDPETNDVIDDDNVEALEDTMDDILSPTFQ